MTKVKLRTKPISGNRHSLYLDFYPAIPNPATGRTTRREFLGIYVPAKPKTSAERNRVKELMECGEAIRAKRQVEVSNKRFGFLDKETLNKDFVEYFSELADKRSSSNQDNWISARYYLEQFSGGSLPMSGLNERVCNDFRDYLLSTNSRRSNGKKLSQNTAHSYFNKFKAALKQAYKDGLIQINLNARVPIIKQEETQREYLTTEEMKALIDTECDYPLLKQAAIFSALTGLRHSDLIKLTWSEIQLDGTGKYCIRFRQKKTSGVESLPVSEYALSFLENRGEPSEQVFHGLKYSAYNNAILKKWVANADITKDITFHCFRHTYAILQLANGTDIYTVSKLLGHRELKTTQVYARVLDQAKREAAEKLRFD